MTAWFDGATYYHCRDSERLGHELGRVWLVMRDGHWRTLKELSVQANAPEASVSARLRDLRKKRFGSHVVDREYISHGLWKYRVSPAKGKA